MDEECFSTQEWHKKQAVDNFNGTWDLIDKKDRTEEENLKMIHMAHASRFHWGAVGTPLELARGEWQVSRVYSLAGMPESALYHAGQSLSLCEANNFGDFDLAFAYEAVARAYMVMKDKNNMDVFLLKALGAGNQIKNKEDKEYFLSELKTIIL